MSETKLIEKDVAFRAFSRLGITVVDVKRDRAGNVIMKKIAGDDGIERMSHVVETRPLAVSDILKAVDHDDGRDASIVTIDGKRYRFSEMEAVKEARQAEQAAAEKAAAEKAAAEKAAADQAATDKAAAEKAAAEKAAADKAAAGKGK